MNKLPKCNDCGLCCITHKVIEITPEEAEKFGEKHCWKKDGVFYLRTYTRGCVFLNNKSCKIYDKRPNICRNFKYGGDKCIKILKKHGKIL